MRLGGIGRTLMSASDPKLPLARRFQLATHSDSCAAMQIRSVGVKLNPRLAS
jgi:hypothetical protein